MRPTIMFRKIKALVPEKAFLWSTYLLAGTFALSPFLSSMALILFCLSGFFHIEKSNYYKNLLSIITLLSFLFIMYFMGLFFSPYQERAIQLVIRTSPIFFVPIIVAITKLHQKINYNHLMQSFVIGILISCVISLVVAIIAAISSGDITYLFYYNLGEFLHIHPTYYSLFVMVSIYFLVLIKESVLSKYKGWLFSLFFVFIFLLQTKIALIVLILYAVFLFFDFKQNKVVKKQFFIPLVCLVLAAFFITTIYESRFKELLIERQKVEIGNFEEDGVSQRAWLWREALEQIKEKPIFGYGLGAQHSLFRLKVEKKILARESQYNYSHAAKKISNLNLHNQFLQIFYEFGIFGISVFTLSVLLLYIVAYRNGNREYLVVHIIFMTFLITENLLDRQMGIYFYAFMLPLLFWRRQQFFSINDGKTGEDCSEENQR